MPFPWNPTGLPRGWLGWLLREHAFPLESHGLAPWIVRLVAAGQGGQREAPRGKPVASPGRDEADVEANVKHHGTSPWHRNTPITEEKKPAQATVNAVVYGVGAYIAAFVGQPFQADV